MKKIFLLLLFFLIPLTTSADFASGWQATSTNSNRIFPTKINGTIPGIQIPWIIATSTTASSTFANGISLTGGCFFYNGSCLTTGGGSGTVGSGTTGQFPYYAANGTTLTATSTLFLSTRGRIGIATTSPMTQLAIVGTTTMAGPLIIQDPTTGVMLISGNNTTDENITIGNNNSNGANAGSGGVVIGNSNTNALGGDTAFLFGIDNVNGAGSDSNVLIGKQNVIGASTQTSNAFGYNNNIADSTESGQAFGMSNAINNGFRSLAYGFSNTISNGVTNGAAYGAGNTVSANSAYAIGANITNSTASSLMIGPSDTAKLTILSTGNTGVASTSPGSLFAIGTSNGINFKTSTTTFASTGGIDLRSGCFAINGVCQGGGSGGSGTVNSGTTGQFPYYASNGTTVTATSTPFLGANGYLGIGTTSPSSQLHIDTGTNDINTPLYISGNTNDFQQAVIQNASNGGNASTGWTACNDIDPQRTGCPNNYIELGMDSSGFNLTPLGAGTPFIIASSTSDTQFTNINPAASWEFFVNGNPGTSILKLKNNGNVGIGTTTPQSTLDVSSSSPLTAITNGNNGQLIVRNSNTTNSNYEDLAFSTVDTNGVSTSTSRILGINTTHTANKVSGDTAFLTNNAGLLAEQMRLTAAGNLGIGSTSPTLGHVVIKGQGTTTGINLLTTDSANSGTGLVVLDNGNVGIGIVPTSKLHLSGTGTGGVGGINIASTGSGVNDFSQVQATNSSGDGGLLFMTSSGYTTTPEVGARGLGFLAPVNASGGMTIIAQQASAPIKFVAGGLTVANEVARFTANQRVGIGTTTPYAKLAVNSYNNGTIAQFVVATSTGAAATTTSFIIDPSGNTGVATSGPWRKFSVVGTVALSGLSSATNDDSLCIDTTTKEIVDAGGLTCALSSQFVKHDIHDLTYEEAKHDVEGLNAVKFVYNNNDVANVGFIAEEVEKIDPRLVDHATSDHITDGHLFKKGDPVGVLYGNITAVLIKYQQGQNSSHSSGNNFEWPVIVLLGVGFIYQQIKIKKWEK